MTTLSTAMFAGTVTFVENVLKAGACRFLLTVTMTAAVADNTGIPLSSARTVNYHTIVLSDEW